MPGLKPWAPKRALFLRRVSLGSLCQPRSLLGHSYIGNSHLRAVATKCLCMKMATVTSLFCQTFCMEEAVWLVTCLFIWDDPCVLSVDSQSSSSTHYVIQPHFPKLGDSQFRRLDAPNQGTNRPQSFWRPQGRVLVSSWLLGVAGNAWSSLADSYTTPSSASEFTLLSSLGVNFCIFVFSFCKDSGYWIKIYSNPVWYHLNSARFSFQIRSYSKVPMVMSLLGDTSTHTGKSVD